ncbi:MAG TPA: hypothetical protein VGM54_06215 [Chthoniobacter sp.]|jgi:hypothetical protein
MQAAEIKRLLEDSPFEPFTIHMANGRQFLIDHPKVAMLSVDKGSLAMAMRAGGFSILDLRLATRVEAQRKSSPGPKR